MKTVAIKVGMTCSGCQGAVTRILSKIEGVQKINVNLETKLVEIECDDAIRADVLVDALMKWSATSGKSVELVV